MEKFYNIEFYVKGKKGVRYYTTKNYPTIEEALAKWEELKKKPNLRRATLWYMDFDKNETTQIEMYTLP